MLDKLTSVSPWVRQSSELQHEVQGDSRAAPDRNYVPVCSGSQVTTEMAPAFDSVTNWVANFTSALLEM